MKTALRGPDNKPITPAAAARLMRKQRIHNRPALLPDMLTRAGISGSLMDYDGDVIYRLTVWPSRS